MKNRLQNKRIEIILGISRVSAHGEQHRSSGRQGPGDAETEEGQI